MKGRNSFIYTFFQVQKCTATKKVIYDRVNDADVKVTATAQIAQMYIRKQEIYTEKEDFPICGTGRFTSGPVAKTPDHGGE